MVIEAVNSSLQPNDLLYIHKIEKGKTGGWKVFEVT